MAQFHDAHAVRTPFCTLARQTWPPGGAAPEAGPPSACAARAGASAAILLTRTPDDALVRRYWDPVRNDGPFRGPCRSVVLIDEIDKAPRDVPNDLLNQIELAYFRIREDDNWRIDADPALWPIVIDHNSEKHLPDAFCAAAVLPPHRVPGRRDAPRASSMPGLRVTVRERREPLAPGAGGRGPSYSPRRCAAPALRRRPGTAELLVPLLGLLRRAARPTSLKPELRDASTGARRCRTVLPRHAGQER